MRRILLTTSALAALMAGSSFSSAADSEPVGYIDFPSTFINVEAGYLFNASPHNVDFGSDLDAGTDKLGDLGGLDALRPGAGGGQGRFELEHRLDETWDFKVGLGLIAQREDHSSADFSGTVLGIVPVSGSASAEQEIDLQIIDAEIGYRPEDIGQVQSRLFAGVRGLHARTELTMNVDSDFSLPDILPGEDGDKLGELPSGFGAGATDDVFAIGPRVGVDIVMPISESDVALVGSASGAVLFGAIESSYGWGTGSRSSTEDQTILNVEGMAGVSIGIGERADITLGYRVAEFSGLTVDRSDIDKMGDLSSDGHSDLLIHGPFARMTIEIP